MDYDVIVIGGGHAGIEAAHVCGVRGLRTLLITTNLDMIGQMSCNPAIGGIAKGNIVREIDALGGVMGKIADRAGIHFRMLNQSKGAAVWGNRAQADKSEYRRWALVYLEENPHVEILQGMVKGVVAERGRVRAVCLDSGEELSCGCSIVTAGTFLNGTIHIGLESFGGGRTGEPSATGLTESISSLGIDFGRLKTGTSPRIDGRTVDFNMLENQPGDEDPWPFSFDASHAPSNKCLCWATKTNRKTHDLIRDNLDRSPLYGGRIKSVGPRYCPSIEDKVVRFGDRQGHTLFLEPEGLRTHEMYLNGLSTSLPFDVQREMVRSVRGLESARILRPGYAIEYDYFFPEQLKQTLESKVIDNLFFAGQVNGTSGYEEAACQGLVAGINAAERLQGGTALILGRASSYTGVLIDDLVTKGTQEPYRMFTSRAEYRLLLRQDNADQRLMPIARERSLISPEKYQERQQVWAACEKWKHILTEEKVDRPEGESKTGKIRAVDYLRRPQVRMQDVLEKIKKNIDSRELSVLVESDIKYEGFINKQRIEIERMQRSDSELIPMGFDYNSVSGLLSESRAKLQKIRPRSIGQAGRIPGVTPADVAVLLIHMNKRNNHIKNVSRETAEL